MLLRRCHNSPVHRVCDSVPGSSTQGCRTTAKARKVPGALQRPGTDLVCESVDGLWRWPRDRVPRCQDDFCTTRSAIFLRPERRECYHIRVEIHQKSLEPMTVSTRCRRGPWLALTSRAPCPGFSRASLLQYTPRALHGVFFSLRGELRLGRPSHRHRPRDHCRMNSRSLVRFLLRRSFPR